MQELAPLIYDLAIMLGLAGIVVVLFQRIHQPVVLGYLVAGMIVGPYTPPYELVKDIQNIHILSELGVIFLMFSLGLEFSFQKLTRVGFSASVTGLIEVVLMIIIGYIAGMLLGWSHYTSLFLGAALSISSTTIIIKAVDELRLKTKRFAELIFGILVVEDLLAILLLVALSTIVITKNVFSFDMVDAIIRLILVVGSWFLIGYFLVPPFFKRIATYISQETLTIISVALCLMLVCIAANFHYSTALGAFIMGSILAETALVHRIEDLVRPIRDIFAAVFFISVGMLINPVIIVQHWGIVLFISLVTIFGKIITTSVAALITGQSFNTAIRVGFGMAQVGEFSFIIVALGLALQVTDEVLYPVIVAVSGITTFTTPYLIRFSGKISDWLEARMPENVRQFFNLYSAWLYRSQASANKNALFRAVSLRLFINAILIAAIFTIIHYLVFHFFPLFQEQSWGGNTIFLILSLLLTAPFIWGMLFAYKSIKISKTDNVRLLPIIIFIWFFTLAEVLILSLIYFNTWSTVTLFLAIAVAVFIFSYHRLGVFYHWFEHRLIRNIKMRGVHKYKELAPWDTHLVEMRVSSNSIFVGKLIADCQIQHFYGVNIVAIYRGEKIITAPRGNDHIHAYDRLIVLGDDEQLDTFKKEVEIPAHSRLPVSILANFRLKAFLLENNHPLIGKSIRYSGIREAINGLVVGIERKNIRILNPNPDEILQTGDLIWLVGEIDAIKQFRHHYFSVHKNNR